MLPLAPGRFSTMKLWPSGSLSFCATMRAMMSVAPPGAYGTMILTGLAGYASCAAAGVTIASMQNSIVVIRITILLHAIISEMQTVDIHAHWYPEEWLRLFEKDGAREDAALERLAGGGYRIKAKQIVNAFDQRFVVVDERVRAIDERRVGG